MGVSCCRGIPILDEQTIKLLDEGGFRVKGYDNYDAFIRTTRLDLYSVPNETDIKYYEIHILFNSYKYINTDVYYKQKINDKWYREEVDKDTVKKYFKVRTYRTSSITSDIVIERDTIYPRLSFLGSLNWPIDIVRILDKFGIF